MDIDANDRAYRTDPTFRMLVDMIYTTLHKKEFTPSEVRAAAMMACFKYEQSKPRIIVLTQSEFDNLERCKNLYQDQQEGL